MQAIATGPVVADLPVDQIRVDGSTQARVETSDAIVAEYADALTSGAHLPPVVVFDDGENVWLADGFHRLGAHIKAEVRTIKSEVHFGSLSDAVLYAAGANGDHGLRRTNQDKRRAAAVLLTHPTWSKWSDSQIARHCKVSSNFVGDVRRSIFNPINDAGGAATPAPAPAVRTVTRNGVTYEQNTARIGKPPAPAINQALTANSQPGAASSEPVSPSIATPRDAAPQPSEVEIITPAASDGDAGTPKMIEVDEEAYSDLVRDLEKTLADNAEMGRVIDADDRLKAAMDEIKRHKAAADSANQSLNSEMGKNNELIRTVKRLTRDVERERKRADAAEQQLAQIRSAA